jgi:hypothetical protein
MWNEKNIFEPSGCLTRQAFKALLEGELSGVAKTAADRHIAECPLCADAMEGFRGNNVSYSHLMDNLDRDFEENYAITSRKGAGRKIWISAIAVAASILLLISLFQINKNGLKTEQVALKVEKKSGSASEVTKPAPPNAQIALNSEPSDAGSKGYAVQKQSERNAVEGKTETIDMVVAEEAEKKSEQMVAANADIPAVVGYAEVGIADTAVLKDEAKTADKIDYIAFAEEKQSEANKFKRSSSLRAKAAKEEAPAPAYAYTLDEQPRFQYKEFSDFGKYIESLFPEITDSSSIAKAYIEVIIDEKGKVTDARMLRGINAEVDGDILKKVKNSPLWIPGKKAGEPVKAKVYLKLNI